MSVFSWNSFFGRRSPGKATAHEPRAGTSERFLCPSCLCFGPLAYACGGCKREVHPFVVRSGGGYVNDCPHCRAVLLPAERAEARGVLALCRRCGETADRQPFHERWIAVVVVPAPEDLASFSSAGTGRWLLLRQSPEVVTLDDGEWLVQVVNLDSLPGGLLPSGHAARRPDALWLGGDANPLRLGEQLDGLVRSAGLSAMARRALSVALGCRRAELASPVSNVLRSRFPSLAFDRGPEELLRWLTHRPDQRVDRMLLVLDGDGEAALRALQDPYSRPVVDREGNYRSLTRQPSRVVNLDDWIRGGGDPLVLLYQAEAIWLPHGDPTEDEHRVAPLLRLAELAPEAGRKVVVALEADTPPRRLRRALEQGFRVVCSGVPADEFLFNGAHSRPQRHGAGHRFLVLATCIPGDFDRLYQEKGVLQRDMIGYGWSVEQTGDRTTYVGDFSDLSRLPNGFGAAPAPGEVQVLWLSIYAERPLAMAERLDRLMRRVWNSEEGRGSLTVCLEQPDPDPALLNLLAARFGRVVCGVPAREVLDYGPLAAPD